MCLLVPPSKGSKGAKNAKSKGSPQTKPAQVPTVPTYSRMPQPKPCAFTSPSTVLQAEYLVEYLKDRYPGELSTWEQYSHHLDLRQLDEHIHAQFDQARSATEVVNKDVKEIQERLDKMGETLKGTDETAKTARELGEEAKKRRDAKVDEQRQMKEEAAQRELERLKGLVAKQEKENEERKQKQAQKKGLDEADLMKILDERDMRRELERLKTLQEGAVSKHGKDCLGEVDLVKILDQRDHDREHARLQALESKRPKDIKQDDGKLQEVRFREILNENEQRKEFERLKAFEAEALKHNTYGHPRPSDTGTASLADIERVIDKLLESHNLKQRPEGSPETLRTGRERDTSPAPRPNHEAETQRTIDQILEILLQRQHIDKATELLERLLYKTEHDSRSDSHWILTEVLGYVDEYLLPEHRHSEHVRPGFYHHHGHSDINCSLDLARQAAGRQAAPDLDL
ncbi:hypothetical protein J7T55_008631 [Diaporthe amygdali]|uniref:uncharacterized protein n=1 Tax=Phomopsis amygdali TaxID=1214568 RepID=UPI0022FE2E0B|nr:uncharacterized protein J7T55_008631 [Diaporthe amygdali]KAJ0121467.1 hypothetical protein J7T55_008631 [Diaporthe amygdali]